MAYCSDTVLLETRSMEIIAAYYYLNGRKLKPAETKIYSRIMHTSGDPDYANHIRIHPEAIQAGCAALSAGCNVYCDVEMVKSGINKISLSLYGGRAQCLIPDEDMALTAKTAGMTKVAVAFKKFYKKLDGAVVVIGNVPAALSGLMAMMQETDIRPALVIGVPAGFVGASEAKEQLMAECKVPYITVQGNKGGSPVAAAITNALLYMIN